MLCICLNEDLGLPKGTEVVLDEGTARQYMGWGLVEIKDGVPQEVTPEASNEEQASNEEKGKLDLDIDLDALTDPNN